MQKPKICSKINHRNPQNRKRQRPLDDSQWKEDGNLRSWREFARVLLLWWRSRERERQSPRRLVKRLDALEFFERKIAALLPNTARSRIPPATRRGRGREGSCLNLAQVNTFWIFWLHLSVSKTSCISMRVDLPGILGNNGPFNNYWQRFRKTSWFVGGGHINYFPKPKVEANNWSARRQQSRYLTITRSSILLFYHPITRYQILYSYHSVWRLREVICNFSNKSAVTNTHAQNVMHELIID